MPIQIVPIIFVSAQTITVAGQRRNYINRNVNRAPEKCPSFASQTEENHLQQFFLYHEAIGI
jgi:hypothetical protein